MVGPGAAKQIAASIKIPTVAIAGITLSNVDEVLATGVSAIAVTAAVLDCDDVAAATKQLKEKLMMNTETQRHREEVKK